MIAGVLLNAQPWVMFSDGEDTYLYDQASGNVYIRIKKGGKNYEDTFVKMGVVDSINAMQKAAQNPQNIINSDLEEQQKLLQQAKELQRSIQGAILGGD